MNAVNARNKLGGHRGIFGPLSQLAVRIRLARKGWAPRTHLDRNGRTFGNGNVITCCMGALKRPGTLSARVFCQ